ncbi:PucR family transcriptional regulator [Rhodococcus sp. NPDC057014]|uniref:PucR family transcriptional regulator n=1 Tax=Rhodococcus sp. NPDC057014 TaxID=3346000 RepID=UPI003634F13B
MNDVALQRLVDELAEMLRRAVVVDDAEVRLLCASKHYGDEDAQRIRAVLQRDVGLQATRHVLSQGVSAWTAPGVIPAHPELGMVARVCAPIRHRGYLLGLLLVIDADSALTTEEITQIEHTATDIGAHLYASHLAARDRRSAREGAVRSLLGDREATRRAGVRYFHDLGWVVSTQQVVVTVLRVLRQPADGAISAARALRAALDAVGPRTERYAVMVDEDAARVVELSNRAHCVEVARERALQLTESVEQLLGAGSRCVAGIGDPVTCLADAWQANEQANVAADAAARLNRLAPVGVWAELGANALILQLPMKALSSTFLPAPLARLLRPGEPDWLLETLASFLDHAGSAPRTAAALHIHRTSLYYRLDRIRQLTGLDLDDGENRLMLHLGVRLLELARDADPAEVSVLEPAAGTDYPRWDPPLTSNVVPVR